MRRAKEIGRTCWVVKVHRGGTRWDYYSGVDLDDVVQLSPEFYGAFRFHDPWTAGRVKSTLEQLGHWAIVKEIK